MELACLTKVGEDFSLGTVPRRQNAALRKRLYTPHKRIRYDWEVADAAFEDLHTRGLTPIVELHLLRITQSFRHVSWQ